MATFTVTTAADVVNASDGVLSLREAVQQANVTAAPDSILFALSLEGETLTLTGGELTVSADLVVDGDRDHNSVEVTIDGNENDRILSIVGGGTDVALSDLTITGGYAGAEENGGGILAGAGTGLTLTGCTVNGNRAGYGPYSVGHGGGIFAGVGSRLSIADSTFDGNRASGDGGGIGAAAGTVLAVQGSELTDNRGAKGGAIALAEGGSLALDQSLLAENVGATFNGGVGGGLYVNKGTVSVTASTLSGNTGYYSGGGVEVRDSTLVLTDSTICDNLAASRIFPGLGGAVRAFSSRVELSGCTVTGNFGQGGLDAAPDYSGVGGLALTYSTLSLANSIVAGNFGADANNIVTATDLYGAVTASNGHNALGSDVTGNVAGDRENVAASMLFAEVDPDTGGGVLALNGGLTPTVALRHALTNPALSGAEPVAAGDLDQRGSPRPSPASSSPDIGAFELNQTVVSTTTTAGNDVLTGTATADTRNGGAGADLLLGLAGNDALSGGDGGDVLRGGPGADTLSGGTGQDTASYRDATASVTVSLTSGTASGALGSDGLSQIENLEGGAGADPLTGNADGNALGGRSGDDRLYGLAGGDRLFGAAGNDRLEGGLGADWLDGGAGIDLISYVNDPGTLGVTVNLTRNEVTRGTETDRLKEIENADGTNNADTLFGNALANRLGGAGGTDNVRGFSGDDVLVGGLGNDVLDGDTGLDLADYAASPAVVVDLSRAADRGTRGSEIDTLREIEGAIGSSGADTFRGDALANLFRGQGGKDVTTGGAGADLFDYDALAHSTVGQGRDRITDFTPGSDDLDLSTIDAHAATPTFNDAFAFLAAKGAAFTAAGQVHWYQAGGNTLVEANVDTNLAPDLQIELAGLKTVSAADFVL
jgi:Ca2+-binding RTX toxin-like protein